MSEPTFDAEARELLGAVTQAGMHKREVDVRTTATALRSAYAAGALGRPVWSRERPKRTGTYWVYSPECDLIFTIRVFLRDDLRVATRPMDMPLEHAAFDEWLWLRIPTPPDPIPAPPEVKP